MPNTQPNGHGKRIVRSATGHVWQACQCNVCNVQTPYVRPAINKAASAGTTPWLAAQRVGSYNSRLAALAAAKQARRRKAQPLAKRYHVGIAAGHSQHLQPTNHGTNWSV